MNDLERIESMRKVSKLRTYATTVGFYGSFVLLALGRCTGFVLLYVVALLWLATGLAISIGILRKLEAQKSSLVKAVE